MRSHRFSLKGLNILKPLKDDVTQVKNLIEAFIALSVGLSYNLYPTFAEQWEFLDTQAYVIITSAVLIVITYIAISLIEFFFSDVEIKEEFTEDLVDVILETTDDKSNELEIDDEAKESK